MCKKVVDIDDQKLNIDGSFIVMYIKCKETDRVHNQLGQVQIEGAVCIVDFVVVLHAVGVSASVASTLVVVTVPVILLMQPFQVPFESPCISSGCALVSRGLTFSVQSLQFSSQACCKSWLTSPIAV